MESGTLHHLARLVIACAEGKKPALSPLAEDDSARLERFETWLLEAVQADPGLLAEVGIRTQVFARRRAPGREAPPEAVRVPLSARETGEEGGALYRLAQPVLERYELHLEATRRNETRAGDRPPMLRPSPRGTCVLSTRRCTAGGKRRNGPCAPPR